MLVPLQRHRQQLQQLLHRPLQLLHQLQQLLQLLHPAAKPYMLAEGKTIKIGWSCHFWNPFNTGMDKYIQDTVKKLSGGRAEVITVGANGDAVNR